MLGTNEVGQDSCKHPVDECRFLTSHTSPHTGEPELKSIVTCIFLCHACGKLHSVGIEVLRGYLADGTIPSKLVEAIDNMNLKKRVEQQAELRAHQLYAQRLKQEEQLNGRTGINVRNPRGDGVPAGGPEGRFSDGGGRGEGQDQTADAG